MCLWTRGPLNCSSTHFPGWGREKREPVQVLILSLMCNSLWASCLLSLGLHFTNNRVIKLRIFPVANANGTGAPDLRDFLSQELQKESPISLDICGIEREMQIPGTLRRHSWGLQLVCQTKTAKASSDPMDQRSKPSLRPASKPLPLSRAKVLLGNKGLEPVSQHHAGWNHAGLSVSFHIPPDQVLLITLWEEKCLLERTVCGNAHCG